MDKILLFSGSRFAEQRGRNKIKGGKDMACKTRFDPRSGSYVKTCSKKRRKKGLFGDVSDLGAGLRGRAKGFLTFAGISM